MYRIITKLSYFINIELYTYMCREIRTHYLIFAGLKIFRGLRSITFIILFFIPEWGPLIKPLIKEPANYIRQIFWDSMNTREKIGYKRGDVIDSLLALKNGEQNPIYSKNHLNRKII